LDILYNRFAVYIYIDLLSGYPDIHLEPLIFFYEAFGQITDPNLKKGYRIAINNDRADKVWWKMTGSLVSVRNLTKSLMI